MTFAIISFFSLVSIAVSSGNTWLYAAHGVTRVPFSPNTPFNWSAIGVNVSRTGSASLYVRPFISAAGVLGFAAGDANNNNYFFGVDLNSGRYLGKSQGFSAFYSSIHGYGEDFVVGAGTSSETGIVVFRGNATVRLNLFLGQGQPELVGVANTTPVLFSAADTSGNYAVTEDGKFIACYNQTSGLTWGADGTEFYNDHEGSVTRFNANLTDDCAPTAVFPTNMSVLSSNHIVSDSKRNVYTIESDGQNYFVKKYFQNGTGAWLVSLVNNPDGNGNPLISVSDDESFVLVCRTIECIRVKSTDGRIVWKLNATATLGDTINVVNAYYMQRMPFIARTGDIILITATNQTAVLIDGKKGTIMRTVPTLAPRLTMPAYLVDEKSNLYLIAVNQGSIFIQSYRMHK